MLPSLEERRETPIWKRSPAIPRPFFSVPAASLCDMVALAGATARGLEVVLRHKFLLVFRGRGWEGGGEPSDR